jgi:hypothetical protein
MNSRPHCHIDDGIFLKQTEPDGQMSAFAVQLGILSRRAATALLG